ncbi:MAG: maleylpyruvate isomerase family mycothiol-dependent enzyme [Nocardioides sp.]
MTLLPDWRRHLARELSAYAARLADAVATGRLDAAVAACPGWTVRDLTTHLIGLHRWVAGAVTDQTGRRDSDPTPADDQLLALFDETAASVLHVLDRPATDPAWSFADDRTVGFWQRRQPHEHAIHRWDLEVALGRSPELDEELAQDGVDEVVRMFWPRQIALGRTQAPTDSLTLRIPGTARSWVLGDPNDPAPTPCAEVSGTGAALVLLLWGRLAPGHSTSSGTLAAGQLSWSGDEERGRALLDLAITP